MKHNLIATAYAKYVIVNKLRLIKQCKADKLLQEKTYPVIFKNNPVRKAYFARTIEFLE